MAYISMIARDRDLARNEEFSKIAVIKFFYSSKKNHSYLWEGFCGENVDVNHVKQQFNMFIHMQTNEKAIRMDIMYANKFNANKN